jgi:hypothetical protein
MNSNRSDSDPLTTPGDTMFLPARHAASAGALESRRLRTLPPDLLRQACQRLSVIALLYALVFFMADFVPSFFISDMPARQHTPGRWIPGVLSILAALATFAFASSRGPAPGTKLKIGLLFQVVGSYGIAFEQYGRIPDIPLTPHLLHVLSPSWVGVWMVTCAVVVPSRPADTLLAALGSASAVPVVLGFTLARAGLLGLTSPGEFFFNHIFSYLLCALMAYVGARVVYKLGADVSRARELGSYRLIERLGSGGMGEVWRGTHHMLARPAAIKFIRPEAIAGSSAAEAAVILKRFELEAKATASLTSAHTIDLYDYGVADSGTFYYVMEMLDGFDLDDLVRRFGPIPPARAIHLLCQACESLDEAHARGLIHRDIKPANIYICRSGTRCDFVKVLDFGLVTTQRALDSAETRLTMPHTATGTPAFMPPEAAMGTPLDGRADLYGLGCVAYWLLTGLLVFEGATVFEVVSKHVHATPDPPSRRAGIALPAELDTLILRCLDKSREARPANARELARMLRAVPVESEWNDAQAETWWGLNLPRGATWPSAETVATPTGA